MTAAQPLLSQLTLAAVQADVLGLVAHDGAVTDRGQEWQLRLWQLRNAVERVHEEAVHMSAHPDGDQAALVRALIRVTSRALLWVQAAEGGFPPSVEDVGDPGQV